MNRQNMQHSSRNMINDEELEKISGGASSQRPGKNKKPPKINKPPKTKSGRDDGTTYGESDA